MPRDTEVRNLERMRGSEGVVRLIAAVVSDNPYRTAKAIEGDPPTSFQGILLECHPSGTLQNALESPKLNFEPVFGITCGATFKPLFSALTSFSLFNF